MADSVKSILVRSPNWLGDQILTYPFFHFLRRAYPRAKITVACVGWVASLQFHNLIDDVILLEKPAVPGFLAKLRAIHASADLIKKKGPFDLGIILPNSFSAAWMFYRAGVKRVIGYATDARGFLLDQALPWDPTKIGHRAEAYVGLLPTEAQHPRKFVVKEFWGIPPEIGNEDLDPGVPSVIRFEPEKAWPGAIAEIKSYRYPIPEAGPFWVLAPGATAESRRWPIENFANLARHIAKDTGWPGVIVGGVAEAPLAEKLASDPELNLKDFTAQGSVASLWPLFKNAKFTIANDSGLAHVAALCGSPVQIIWGAGDPKRTEPLGPGRVRVMFNPVDCWPCERNSCNQVPAAKLACIRGIQSAEVWEEMKRGFKF
jgi:heptosyltransferase II